MAGGRAALAIAALGAALAGCAQVGPVLPPSAGIPAVVHDFTAHRLGNNVDLAWTAPVRTSDGVSWNRAKFGAINYQICAWPGANNSAKICPQAFTVAGQSLSLAQLGAGAAAVTLGLAANNLDQVNAGWSNRITVPLTPVAAPPQLDTATPSDAGVTLRWTAPAQPESAASAAVVIYRGGIVLAQRPAQPAGAAASYLDASAEPNQHYVYWLRSAAGVGAARVESADSRHLQVGTADVFPPPAPTGLQAVSSSAGVELSWTPSSARDLAGYNVYRQPASGGAWTKLNPQLVPTPAYFDAHAAAPFRYAVSAVDHAGNESPRSAPVAAR